MVLVVNGKIVRIAAGCFEVYGRDTLGSARAAALIPY